MRQPKPVKVMNVGVHRIYNYYRKVGATIPKSEKQRTVKLGEKEIINALGEGWEVTHPTKSNIRYINRVTGEDISRRQALNRATSFYTNGRILKYSEWYTEPKGEARSPIENLLNQFKPIHERYPRDGYLLIAYGRIASELIGTEINARTFKGEKWGWAYITKETMIASYNDLSQYFSFNYYEKLQTWFSEIKYLQLIRVAFR